MKAPHITVTGENLESFDQIIHSGAKGTHLLFTAGMIRDAFSRRPEIDQGELDDALTSLQPVISELLLIDDLEDRKAVILDLDPSIRDLLVHLYFGFIESYLADESSAEIFH